MTPLTFVILSLAAYRASRAVAIDSITQPFRDWLSMQTGNRVGYFFDGLLSCGFCIGFWLSGITYWVWCVSTHHGYPSMLNIIHWWAIAGLQSLFIAIDTFFLREAPPK